ncbi:hypothetical protein [Cellvibrio sp. OA-2007]|uniref:hypothetical protein n=1 Tax=Cellvibrio sp. OA-2007 TaxID=529823 RepID=UPI000A73DAEE|nr:hypothetical protein [Cellvibrio sp. OA-2007]
MRRRRSVWRLQQELFIVEYRQHFIGGAEEDKKIRSFSELLAIKKIFLIFCGAEK